MNLRHRYIRSLALETRSQVRRLRQCFPNDHARRIHFFRMSNITEDAKYRRQILGLNASPRRSICMCSHLIQTILSPEKLGAESGWLHVRAASPSKGWSCVFGSKSVDTPDRLSSPRAWERCAGRMDASRSQRSRETPSRASSRLDYAPQSVLQSRPEGSILRSKEEIIAVSRVSPC